MSIKTKKQIYLVYDFLSGASYTPNCLDHNLTEILFREKGFINDKVMDYYYQHHVQMPNLAEGLNVSNKLFKNISIYDYETNSNIEKNNSIFLYPIEPYANMDHVLGNEHSYSKQSALKHISLKSLSYLQNTNNNFYLIISFANEGTLSDNCIKSLYNICDEYSIPRFKMIFVIASADIDKHHENFCIKENIPIDNRIKTIYWTWSLREKVEEAYKIENTDFNINMDGTIASIATESDLNPDIKRPHNFLMFNRRMRHHRVVLTSLLGLDFINKNLISFDYNHAYDPPDEDFFIYRVLDKYVDQCIFNMKEIIEKKPISFIDFKNVYDTVGFGCELKDPYIKSYIHITSETNFKEPGVYFSEKTWKPILNLQPFIMLNYEHSLKYLKDLGFKTFHPFINEDYDNIEDPRERISFIYEEIVRINSLPTEVIHDWFYEIKDILIYNKNHALKHIGDYMTNIEKDYLNSIINYVESNKNN